MNAATLPNVLAGPLLRRLAPQRLLLWLVGSRPLGLELALYPSDASPTQQHALDECCRIIPIGSAAHLHLIDLPLEVPLPCAVRIDYDLRVVDRTGSWQALPDWAPHLLHDGAALPSFVIAERPHHLMYGSCRKPHHPDRDGLARADAWLGDHYSDTDAWPAWLLMTGDQVYADDVAGPMLAAIHALIAQLGLFDETLEGATVDDSKALYAARDGYYHRETLLPDVTSNAALRERFFGGVKKPVFTSANAHNHLIGFAEIMAMYLLVWSPIPWQLITPACPKLDDDDRALFHREQAIIDDFVTDLPAAARLMAHLPTLMIFDDHDVTDDWNLTADWEACAYGHPFSRRIIGNALIAYLLCQAWGNDPERLAAPLNVVEEWLEQASRTGRLACREQDTVIDALLAFEGWEFQVEGTPRLVVLDTRTRRWRSERAPTRPSGLMNWEALTDLQQQLLDAPCAVIVSPAPIFGVKLIESVQRLFTLAGKPLMVDAENWMAHRSAASALLNIFRHSRTPGNYVVLSGDVHYSFAYDVVVRHRDAGPHLWQITSSGIKNAFPVTLLDWFDRLNRWLFAPWSPLNWFTKRHPLAIYPRDPDHASAGERLWNGSGIGLVRLDETGRPVDIRQLDVRGFEVVFPPPDALLNDSQRREGE